MPISEFSRAAEVEDAIRHSLEKDPAKRTQTVEQMVEELQMRNRHFFAEFCIHVSQFTGSSLPVSSFRVLTNPPQSKVFVDNVAVGANATGRLASA